MFDLACNEEIGKIASDVFKDGGLVAACCHGPAGEYHTNMYFFKYLLL